MEVAIQKMCHSQGMLIPKPIPAQVGLEGSETERISRVTERALFGAMSGHDRKTLRLSADLQARGGVIEIRPNPSQSA